MFLDALMGDGDWLARYAHDKYVCWGWWVVGLVVVGFGGCWGWWLVVYTKPPCTYTQHPHTLNIHPPLTYMYIYIHTPTHQCWQCDPMGGGGATHTCHTPI